MEPKTKQEEEKDYDPYGGTKYDHKEHTDRDYGTRRDGETEKGKTEKTHDSDQS